MKDFLNDENKTAEELEGENKARKVTYEENDNWEFEASAPTLENSLLESVETDASEEKPSARTAPVRNHTPARKTSKSKKSGNTGKFVAIAVITAVIIGVLVWLGIGYYTSPNTNEKMNPGNVALTVGETDVSIGMYNYYYTCIYQNYVQYSQYGYYNLDTTVDYSKQTTTDSNGNKTTWAKVFVNDTVDQIKYITAYYEEAVNNGITLTEEQEETIEQQLSSLKESASESDMSVDDYISETYGDYCGYATLKKMLTQCYVAENYYQKRLVENKVDEDEVNAYFKEHSGEYTEVPFAYLQMGYDSEDSKSKAKTEEQAKEYAKNIKTVADMKKALPKACASLINQYVEAGYFEDASEAEETLSENIETVLTQSDDSFTEEGMNWLFSKNTKIGDCATFTDTDNALVYVVLKTGDAKLRDDIVYSVRHILIMPESDDEDSEQQTEFTEEQWAAAKKKANNILNKFNKGDKSEYSFALLAEQYTDDTESTSQGSSGYYGGLYAGTELGKMVKSFEEWSIDDNRKYGDVDIVKSDYGYHIMFFVEKTKSYLYNCENAVISEKENEFIDNMTVEKHKGAMKKTKVAEPESDTSDTDQSIADASGGIIEDAQ